MKTNRLIKKGDDRWDGPFQVTEVYSSGCACCLKLPPAWRLYPVFHIGLLRHKSSSKGLVGQADINAAEKRHVHKQILECENGIIEPVEKWEFVDLLDVYN